MAYISTPNNDFKASSISLLVQILQIWQLWTDTIHSFLLRLIPLCKLKAVLIFPQSQTEITPSPLPPHSNNNMYILFKSLTYNLPNLKELCNWGINVPLKILQTIQALHEIPNHWGIVCRGCFIMQSTISLFLLLTLQIICQGQAKHDTTFKKF